MAMVKTAEILVETALGAGWVTNGHPENERIRRFGLLD